MYVRALRVIVESSVLARHGWGQETMVISAETRRRVFHLKCAWYQEND